MAPHLRVRVLLDTSSVKLGNLGRFGALGDNLEKAGHEVLLAEEPRDIEHADLVVVDSNNSGWVAKNVDKLVPYARERQMFVHTCLMEGTQLFDDVEIHGAVPMAAHEIIPGCWVTSATDELGEAVVAMLVTEAREIAIPITDMQRPRLAAAKRMFELASTAEFDAVELLSEVLPDASTLLAEQLESIADSSPAPQDEKELERSYRAIKDPAVARFFAELERRHAERSGHMEAELWALSKTMRKDK